MTDPDLKYYKGPIGFIAKGWVQENGDHTAGFRVNLVHG